MTNRKRAEKLISCICGTGMYGVTAVDELTAELDRVVMECVAIADSWSTSPYNKYVQKFVAKCISKDIRNRFDLAAKRRA